MLTYKLAKQIIIYLPVMIIIHFFRNYLFPQHSRTKSADCLLASTLYTGRGRLIIDGASVHMFVFGVINFFWNRLLLQSVNTNIWICAPLSTQQVRQRRVSILEYKMLFGIWLLYNRLKLFQDTSKTLLTSHSKLSRCARNVIMLSLTLCNYLL